MNKFYQTLQKVRNNDFDNIWREAASHAQAEDEEFEPRPKRHRNDDRSKYQHICNEILNILMSQIKSSSPKKILNSCLCQQS